MLSSPEYCRLNPYLMRLQGVQCLDCRAKFLPARTVCLSCKSRSLEKVFFNATGTVISWTQVAQPPSGFPPGQSFYLALVQLDEGPKVLAQLADQLESPIKEMRVKVVIRRLTHGELEQPILYGFKFQEIL